MSQANRTTNNIERFFHPVSHYKSPDDVLSDARLSADEKRVILSSWASDMYVVESDPTLREVPGMPNRLRLNDVLSALKQLDDENDSPRGGLATQLPRSGYLECRAFGEPLLVIKRHAATMQGRSERPALNNSRWTREANVRLYRRLLETKLTEIERNFIERRLAEELHSDRSLHQL